MAQLDCWLQFFSFSTIFGIKGPVKSQFWSSDDTPATAPKNIHLKTYDVEYDEIMNVIS